MTGRGRRLLVVEDEPLTASLLADALASQGFEVVAVDSFGAAFVALTTFAPDAVLLDIDLGDGPSGIDLAHVLTRNRSDIPLVFLTQHPDPRTAGMFDDLPPGCAFLSKGRVQDTQHLTQAIDAVLASRPSPRHDQDPAKPLAALTAKEIDVLRMVAMGFTNERIAETKGAGISTVERWTKDIFGKLGIDADGALNRRVEATRMFVAAAGLPSR